MVKNAEESVKLQALAEENKLLKEKIAQQEASANLVGKITTNIEDEIKKIRRKGKSQANTITVQEFMDHVRVTLWTKWGKQVGPLHPDNAIQTLHRFADIGIALSSDKPNSEQITSWYNSPEGKAYLAKEDKRRTLKDKSRRAGQLERLTAEIAKMAGTTVEALNRVLKPNEVKK